jgi:hypothetical protein
VYRNDICIMINMIRLHVSTRNESSSGHLDVLLLSRNNKFKWPEDDSLRVETCSRMIYIYIVAID